MRDPANSWTGTNPTIRVSHVPKGSQLRGTFRLEHGDETTIAIPFDADEHLVKQALEALYVIGPSEKSTWQDTTTTIFLPVMIPSSTDKMLVREFGPLLMKWYHRIVLKWHCCGALHLLYILRILSLREYQITSVSWQAPEHNGEASMKK